ncbi:MAG: serine protein kinase RIO [Methanomassiliicoccales archaeon]|jgi:RIO kinase 1
MFEMRSGDDDLHTIEREVQAIKTKDYGAVDDEDRKTLDEVFDKQAMFSIYKLMKNGFIASIDFAISTGKEANVFHVTSPEGKSYALKIFRTSNLTFKRIARYIEGDQRFLGLHGSRRKIIMAWTTKEYRNLSRLDEAGVRVPKPIKFHNNMLLMEYIGTATQPAPMIRNVLLEEPEKVYKLIVKYMRLAYQKAELVHGDLSEYNILWQDGPVIIDCGQAMTLDHPNALEFLKRDVENVNHYFRSLDVDVMGTEETLAKITKETARKGKK